MSSIPTFDTFGNGFRQESVAMLDDLFANARMQTRCRQSWLREPIDEFLKHLAERNYNRNTLRQCSYHLLSLGEFAARQDVKDVAALPQWIEPFLAQLRAGEIRRQKVRLALRRFLRHLQRINLVPAPEPPLGAPHAKLVADYLWRLGEQPTLRYEEHSRRPTCMG